MHAGASGLGAAVEDAVLPLCRHRDSAMHGTDTNAPQMAALVSVSVAKSIKVVTLAAKSASHYTMEPSPSGVRG